MDLHELIEMAVLDAMGLLDPEEGARFEAGFKAAPPAVQAQVRREQTRLANIEALLPQVEAPAGMKARVLETVREEIRLARSTAGPLSLPEMLPSKGVSRLWRAAALGLLAASVTFGVMLYQVMDQYNRTAERLRGDQFITALAQQFGQEYIHDVFFNPDTKRVLFSGANEDFQGQASLYMNPEWTHAKLLCSGIASGEGRTLRLAIIDEQGNTVQVLREFTSGGAIEPIEVELPANLAGQVALIKVGSGLPAPQVLCTAQL